MVKRGNCLNILAMTQSNGVHIPIKFVAAEAGFFPSTPLTLFADIATSIEQFACL